MSLTVSPPKIDIAFCGIALRAVTEELALHAKRPSADDTVRDVLPGLFELAARGRAMLASLLDARYPDVRWGSDETEAGRALSAIIDRRWLYDPIDGAYHFIQGLPLWSSSLALVEDGKIILALVYDPTSREMFTSVRGEGAALNERLITVSDKRTLAAAVVGTGLPIFGHGDPTAHTSAIARFAAISQKVFVVRQMASASLQLAYVAAGRLDVYWEPGYDLHDWAAGALLVQEAGGVTIDYAGEPFEEGGDGLFAGSERLVTNLRVDTSHH